MNEGTAIEIARCKMKELGIGKRYVLRYRHFRLDANESTTIKGENNLYILIEPSDLLRVSSKAGIYNMSDAGANELQHVHRGLIKVFNSASVRLDARFLQVIPLHKKTKKT